MYHLYNRKLDSYMCVGEDDIALVTDKTMITRFTIMDLIAAREIFAGFTTFKDWLHVVPEGTNKAPGECETVETFFKDYREKFNEYPPSISGQ